MCSVFAEAPPQRCLLRSRYPLAFCAPGLYRPLHPSAPLQVAAAFLFTVAYSHLPEGSECPQGASTVFLPDVF